MRAALLGAWPGLAHFYNVHPWSVARLAPAELRDYLDDLRDYHDAQRRRAQDAQRPSRRGRLRRR